MFRNDPVDRSVPSHSRWRLPALAVLLALAIGSPMHAPARAASEQAAAFYEDAQQRLHRGEIEAAIIQLKNALLEDQDFVAARILIGQAYLMTGDGAAAQKELQQARAAGGDESLIVVPLARALFLQRKWEDLLGNVKAGTRPPTVEADVRVLRGQAFLELRRSLEAETMFTDARRLAPDKAEPLVGLAAVAVRRAKLDEADALAVEAIANNPKIADAWYLRADIARTQRRRTDALGYLNRTIELQPGHLQALQARAAVLIELGRHLEALPDIAAVEELIPNDPLSAYLRALVLLRDGKREEALQTMRDVSARIREYDPSFVRNHPQTLLLVGFVAYLERKYDQAQAYLEQYVRLDSAHAGARKMLADILLRSGKFSEAVRVLSPAVRLSPNDPHLLAMLGSGLMKLGRYTEASEALDRATKLSPKLAGLHTNLALSRLALGDRDSAIPSLELAMSLEGDSKRAAVLLGLVYLRDGEYDKALTFVAELLKEQPDNAVAYNLQGAAYARKGDLAAARASLEKAVEIDPTFVNAQQNLANLDLREEDFESARQRYQALIGQRAGGVMPYIELSAIAERQGRLEEAADWLEQAKEVISDAVEPQLRLIALYMRLGRTDQAVFLARDLRNRHSENMNVLAMLGRTEHAAGQTEEAMTLFARMAQLARESERDLLRVSQLQLSINDLAGARRTLERALFVNTRSLPVVAALSELDARLGDTKTAMRRIDALQGAVPDNPAIDQLRGNVLMRAHRFDEAIAAYEKALARRPDAALVLRHHLALRAAGREREAIAALEAWLAEHPDDKAIQRALAVASVDIADIATAIRRQETLLRVTPDDPQLLNNLAWLYHRTGDARALATAERAHKLAPERAETLDTLGWILIEDGQLQRGLPMLREARARNSRDPQIQYHLAAVLARLGRGPEAISELRALLAGDAKPALRELAEKLLSELQAK